MNHMRTLLLIFLFAITGFSSAVSQIIKDPTTWQYEVKQTGEQTFDLIFRVSLKEHWHIWALEPGGDGMQLPPEFIFENNAAVTLLGGIKEKGKKITGVMDGVDGEVSWYADKIEYTQSVRVTENTVITGEHTYQVCDDKQCLPPKTLSFQFEINQLSRPAVATNTTAEGDSSLTETTTSPISDPQIASQPLTASTASSTQEGEKRSLLWLFLMAFGGGIAAVITPCVYAMIPITVSFFTKRSKNRKEGIRNATWYSLSIILIFTILGVLISLVFGANALNNLSTNWIANLVFFIIFVVFGLSFLGAFEITLPSSWTSKTDSKAGLGSFSGISSWL